MLEDAFNWSVIGFKACMSCNSLSYLDIQQHASNDYWGPMGTH